MFFRFLCLYCMLELSKQRPRRNSKKLVCLEKSSQIIFKLLFVNKIAVQNATQNYKIQRGNFRVVSEFFTDVFSTVLIVVNTRHLMLKNWGFANLREWEITDCQTTDRWQRFYSVCFRGWFWRCSQRCSKYLLNYSKR